MAESTRRPSTCAGANYSGKHIARERNWLRYNNEGDALQPLVSIQMNRKRIVIIGTPKSDRHLILTASKQLKCVAGLMSFLYRADKVSNGDPQPRDIMDRARWL